MVIFMLVHFECIRDFWPTLNSTLGTLSESRLNFGAVNISMSKMLVPFDSTDVCNLFCASDV